MIGLDFSPLACALGFVLLAVVLLLGYAIGVSEIERELGEKYQTAIDNLRDVPARLRGVSVKRALDAQVKSTNHRRGSKL